MLQIEQLSLPLTTDLDVGALHLQTLDVATASLVMKGVCSPPAVWAIELSIACCLFLLSSVVLNTSLAIDSTAAS